METEPQIQQYDSHQLWADEYLCKGIPSSYREDPTKTLIHFISFLQNKGIKAEKALDLGCGRGRNAFYLAQQGYSISCFDLVEENILEINQKAFQLQLPILGFCHDVTLPWPVQKNQFDVAIDIFCYKHLIRKEAQKKYREQLSASLKSHSYYFLNLASTEDGFYGPLLTSSPDPSIKLIIDPHSKIPSLLYDLDEVVEEFSDICQLIEAKKISSKSPMYGKEYPRQVLSFIFQKKS